MKINFTKEELQFIKSLVSQKVEFYEGPNDYETISKGLKKNAATRRKIMRKLSKIDD